MKLGQRMYVSQRGLLVLTAETLYGSLGLPVWIKTPRPWKAGLSSVFYSLHVLELAFLGNPGTRAQTLRDQHSCLDHHTHRVHRWNQALVNLGDPNQVNILEVQCHGSMLHWTAHPDPRAPGYLTAGTHLLTMKCWLWRIPWVKELLAHSLF